MQTPKFHIFTPEMPPAKCRPGRPPSLGPLSSRCHSIYIECEIGWRWFAYAGHGRSGTVSNDHDRLLPRCYGLHPDVRHHQRRLFQRRTRLVSTQYTQLLPCSSCFTVWRSFVDDMGQTHNELLRNCNVSSSILSIKSQFFHDQL